MRNYWFGIILLTVSSCDQISEEHISGSWKLLEVFDAGDSIQVDLSVAQLKLSIDHTFIYDLTDQEQLSGTYRLENDILNLWCQNPPDTIKVQVLSVDEEQMTLRMNHDGVERKIGLVRQELAASQSDIK